MREVSEQGAYLQLAQLCARSEHCRHDALEKMRRWGLGDEAQARVVERLVAGRYIDDERYARAFVHDKVSYNHWGRRKVEQALWAKHIDGDTARRVLDEVSADDYAAVLRPLLSQKRRSLQGLDAYGQQQRLVKFALGRGFTYDVIRRVLDGDISVDCDED